MYGCVALPDNIAKPHVRSVIQSTGAFCTYYRGEHGCDDPWMTVNTKPGPWSIGNLDKNNRITRVMCVVPALADGDQDPHVPNPKLQDQR
jgi:hypothetical protein